MEFGLGLFGLFITYQIASGGPITTISLLDMLVRFGLWIGIIVGIIEAFVQLFRLLRGEPRKSSGNIKEVEASY